MILRGEQKKNIFTKWRICDFQAELKEFLGKQYHKEWENLPLNVKFFIPASSYIPEQHEF